MISKAVLHAPRDLRIEQYEDEVSSLASDQIRVETIVSALSTGTDRGNYEGAERVPGAPDYPRWVGYSNVGQVIEVGNRVERFGLGDRVFTNQPHLSEFVIDQNKMVIAIDDSIGSERAAFTYLYYLGLLALRRGMFSFGETVAVVGLGVLGLATVELARAWGGRVIAIGNDSFRLQKATEVGAHCSLDYRDPAFSDEIERFTNGVGVDLVILAANPWSAYRVGVEILREGGRLSILSLPGRGESILEFNPLSMGWFYRKALHIISVSLTQADRIRLEPDLAYLLELMQLDRIHPERLITHRLPYRDMVKAYEAAYQRDKSMIGTVFLWNEG
jgi:threonine dehydrogenase-like Zn-dependent dehydrogenase